MLHCSRKEHVLYTLRTYTKYMFFDRFYFVSHHTPRDSLMCDLWPTLHMNGALQSNYYCYCAGLKLERIVHTWWFVYSSKTQTRCDRLSGHQKHRRDVSGQLYRREQLRLEFKHYYLTNAQPIHETL